MDNIFLNSKIEISGFDDDKPYIEMTTRLCYLDYANLNGAILPSDATDSFETLKDMPVVAKVKNKDFGSHEVKVNSKGEVSFGTQAIGTHVDVWVKDDEVEIPNIGVKTVPCLFATSKVWKRFDKAIEIIKKYYDESGLFSSWELQPKELEINDDGTRKIPSFYFLSNCLLGKDVAPAYGSNAKTLQVAALEDSFENELAEALAQDVRALDINNEGKEECLVAKKIQESALSMESLSQKLWEKLNPKGWSSTPCYSIWNIYPEDKKVLCRDWEKSDEELMVFEYTVENDEITLSEGTPTQLSKVLSEKNEIIVKLDETAKLISQKELKIAELEVSNTQLSEDLSQKIDALIKAGEELEKLKLQVSELSPYKEQVDAIEKAEKEAQLAKDKEDLKQLATKGGYITTEELETSEEIKVMIESLDSKSIKALIAERMILKLDESQPTTQTGTKVESASANIADGDDEPVDSSSFMSNWLKRK